MESIELRAARERLAIETEINILLVDLRNMNRKMESLQNALKNLRDDPEWYFRVDNMAKGKGIV